MEKPTIIKTYQSTEPKMSDMKNAQNSNSAVVNTHFRQGFDGQACRISASIFDKIIKYSIYLLVFLMPLFFLPFSFE